jgi:phosphonate transport system substrate-binding protein
MHTLPSGACYKDRPVYFSDVVVRRDSKFHTFADLRGASWAYNEPGSHSGYNVVGYHLATLGEGSGYFGQVVESGAHQVSLQMILDGRIDASAIDSLVSAFCTLLFLNRLARPLMDTTHIASPLIFLFTGC